MGGKPIVSVNDGRGEKVKVLQINSLAKTKSTGRLVYEMHKEFLERGIESYVATSALSMDEDQYGQYIIGSKVDMKVHALLSRISGLQGYFSFKATESLIRYINEICPEIVVIHVLHSNFINVNRLLSELKQKRISTVIVLHDLWFMTGHCVYPTTTQCTKYKTICRNCNQKHLDNKSYFIDTSCKVWKDRHKIYNNWDDIAVVGVSRWVADCAAQSSLMKNLKYNTFVYNWIDREKFRPQNTQIDKKDKFYILGVSETWTKEKGLMDFIKLSHIIDNNEKIILVGHINESEKTKFKKNNVTFVDYTSSVDELVELYNASDVYVSMSKQETFGKTIAEAICCGTPVVTYECTACPELVASGCGYTVKMKDINGVYEKIQEIKNNKKSFYYRACIEKAEIDFSVKTNINKYIDLFNEMLKNKVKEV